jgi:hypothetical protein
VNSTSGDIFLTGGGEIPQELLTAHLLVAERSRGHISDGVSSSVPLYPSRDRDGCNQECSSKYDSGRVQLQEFFPPS